MDRTIPYWSETIDKNAIQAGKSVLVASSENAIRGLLMHLLDIPEERIAEIEIPTGLPLMYDYQNRRLSLLEGDVDSYNFGKGGAELLFGCIPADVYDGHSRHHSHTPDLSKSRNYLLGRQRPIGLDKFKVW